MVTGEQVREACVAAGITRIDHHKCSMCGAIVFYTVMNGQLFFCPRCDCSRGYCPPEPCLWGDAADWINMQTMDVHRERIAKAFGLELAHGPQLLEE